MEYTRSLAIYFLVLIVLCAALIGGAISMGQQGAYLAQFYMLTPAAAAIVTRLFAYPPRFSDAGLRPGPVRQWLQFWLASLGIVALYAVAYTLSGAVRLDLSGQAFLDRLAAQFAALGQDMAASLPQGMTPQMMLWIYFFGGLTVFNIIPGIVTGFGEEFGHRGFMFPLLYRLGPRVGLIGGGLIWYLWHVPLMLIVPSFSLEPTAMAVNVLALAVGSVCTFVYLVYVYAKTGSIWITALAHITINNASQSLSYFLVLQDQLMANVATVLVMALVVGWLYWRRELDVIARAFGPVSSRAAGPLPA
jgi:membrane protease YdiL (CAAX protease family)